MTLEERAELKAELERMLGPKARPRPKVVVRDDLGTVRDADVHVSRADVNAAGQDRVVEVRRPDWVTINMDVYERQLAERAEERRQRRALDPCGLGHWGPLDEDD
jgi:hypothetical protein